MDAERAGKADVHHTHKPDVREVVDELERTPPHRPAPDMLAAGGVGEPQQKIGAHHAKKQPHDEGITTEQGNNPCQKRADHGFLRPQYNNALSVV